MQRFLRILIFFLLVTQISFAQWFWQNPIPQGNTLNAIKYISENKVIAVGDFGTIIISTNGGIDWEIKHSGADFSLNAVSFADELYGWVVGEDGIILKTTNGGVTWFTQNSGTSTWLKGVWFVNENVGVTVGWDQSSGHQNILLRTSDGGNNWTEIQTGTTHWLNSVCFVNENIGFVVGYDDAILKTTDSGITWSIHSSNPQGNDNLFCVSFCDINNGAAVGDGEVCWTTDSGENWLRLSDSPTYMYGISMINETTATIVGQWNYIFRTTDAGATWQEQGNFFSSLFEDVTFIDSENGIAVGIEGRITRTTNGGTNWSSQTGEINNTLQEASFIDENIGWVIADSKLIHTTDGGYNWTYQETGQSMWLSSVCFIDQNNGTVVGTEYGSELGIILHTTDGGQNWSNQLNVSATPLNGVYFTDADNGTVVGTEGKILRTTDGGDNWTFQNSGTTNLLEGVYFINKDTGWIAGVDIILHTTDGGNFWFSQMLGNIGYLYDISFADALNGMAVGYRGQTFMYGGVILRTTDGGASWMTQLHEDIRIFFDVSFVGDGIGYVCSGDPMWGGNYAGSADGTWYTSSILKTTNSGETWSHQITISDNLLSIFFTDENIGYAVGTGGAILKTSNGGVSFVEEQKVDEVPSKFLFSQNYPNPFNPSTKIKYSIPQSSQVVIKIFDVLGNEIETLVNQVKPSGTYELTWNAANLPSGVYFYQLRAGDFIQTKKMILLR